MTLSRLDEMIALMEATIPANPNSAKGEALTKSLERELRGYFEALEKAMPDLSEIYYKYVQEG